MQATGNEIVTQALRLCGQSGAPGRPYDNTAPQMVEGLLFLNRMLDSWNILRNTACFKIDKEEFTLSDVGEEYYTIGTGGQINVARPNRIEVANIIMSGSPDIRIPLAIWDYQQYAGIAVRDVSALPNGIYYDGGFGLDGTSEENMGRIYPWPVTDQEYGLELWLWHKFPTSITATSILGVPDGNLDAIVYNLAVRLAPLYWEKVGGLLADVKLEAQRLKAAMESLNSRSGLLANDAGFLQTGQPRPYWNILTGSTMTGGRGN